MTTHIEPKKSNGLQYLLGINGVQTMPEACNIETVQPVVDMNMNGHALLHDISKYQSIYHSEDVVGQNSLHYPLISYGSAVGVLGEIVVPHDHHFVVWGISLLILFDNAGRTAFANKDFAACLRLYQPQNLMYVDKWFGMWRCNTDDYTYFDGMARSGTTNAQNEKITSRHIGIVPATCYATVELFTEDGANTFPANTYFGYRVMGQSVPCGAPLPMGV